MFSLLYQLLDQWWKQASKAHHVGWPWNYYHNHNCGVVVIINGNEKVTSVGVNTQAWTSVQYRPFVLLRWMCVTLWIPPQMQKEMVSWKSQAAGQHELCDNWDRGDRGAPLVRRRPDLPTPRCLHVERSFHHSSIASKWMIVIRSLALPMKQFLDSSHSCPTALEAFGRANQISPMTHSNGLLV